MNNNISISYRNQEPESSVLYVVGTPIGNLNDISPRAINILKKVSLIACEDTRQTRKIMNKFEIKNILMSFNKHNSITKISKIIEDLKSGKSIAIVSDAGMPGICDPGEDLIKVARLRNIEVICIPGPCAAITALASSGMPSSTFVFEGFLPRKRIDREKIFQEISMSKKTTILFEAPHRLKKLLNDLKDYCGGEREIQVSRELTKQFEENTNTNLNAAIEFFGEKRILGEITLVIKGITKEQNSEFDKPYLKKQLKELIDAGLSLSAASKYLAKKKNLTKSMLYNLY